MEADTIFFRYGDRGITRYTTANGKALISDDTQMTLFTADGLFAAERRYRCPTAAQYIGCIHENYLNWLVTQDKTFRLPEGVARSPLLDCGELYARRAPGGTCLSALESGYCGTFDRKLNRSKGCGGVMRVAPVAVRFAHQRVSAQDVARLAAQAAGEAEFAFIWPVIIKSAIVMAKRANETGKDLGDRARAMIGRVLGTILGIGQTR